MLFKKKLLQIFSWILPVVLLISLYIVFGILGLISFILISSVVLFLYYMYRDLRRGIILILIATFFINGLSRYLYYWGGFADLYLGFVFDITMVLLLIFYLIKFKGRYHWNYLNRDIILLLGIWFCFEIFQLSNPYLFSFDTWFANFRAEALYILLLVAVTMLIFNTYKDLQTLIVLWCVFASLVAIKGILQLAVGLDSAEHAFVMGPAFGTHMLFGRLRVFSILSDAGIFGASQAQTAVVAAIMFFESDKKNHKFLYLVTVVLTMIGTSISGTRGALIIPFVGAIVYLIFKKNIKYLVLGGVFIALVYSFFRYTTLLQDVYQINRMRTALDPDNASLNVRLENQKKFAQYLKDKPLGIGVGSVGNHAMKKGRSSIAAIPTDSWYVRIWVESGIVGIVLYLFILIYIMIKGAILISRVENLKLRARLVAIYCSIAGVMIANYGNQIFGQHPLSMYTYCALGIIFMANKIDQDLKESSNKSII